MPEIITAPADNPKYLLSVHQAGPHDAQIGLGIDRFDGDDEHGVTAYLDIEDVHSLIDTLQAAIRKAQHVDDSVVVQLHA